MDVLQLTHELLRRADRGALHEQGADLLAAYFGAEHCRWTTDPAALVCASAERLALVVPVPGRRRAGAWVVDRGGCPLTGDDLRRAEAVLPALVVLERLAGRSGGGAAERVVPAVWHLTPREAAVARLVAEGLSAQSAARRLGISERTVRKHLERVYAKSGLHDRLLLARALAGPAPAAVLPPWPRPAPD